jgi:hypothetical protein
MTTSCASDRISTTTCGEATGAESVIDQNHHPSFQLQCRATCSIRTLASFELATLLLKQALEGLGEIGSLLCEAWLAYNDVTRCDGADRELGLSWHADLA